MRFAASEKRYALTRLIAPSVGGECFLNKSRIGIAPAFDPFPAVLDVGTVTGFKRRGSRGCRTGERNEEYPCSSNRYPLDAKQYLPNEADYPYLGHEMLLCFYVGSCGLVKAP